MRGLEKKLGNIKSAGRGINERNEAMGKIKITIDGREVEVDQGITVLEAAKKANINIPTLCAMPELHHTPGACRVCVVEVERSRTLQAACVYPVANGMKIKTNSERVRKARKRVIEFLLSDHPQDCNICRKHGNCELQQVAELVGVREVTVPRRDFTTHRIDDSSPALIRDGSKCINCLRCVAVCSEVQGVSLLTLEGRGFNSKVVPALSKKLEDSVCTYCGQCAVVCPTGPSSSGTTLKKCGGRWRTRPCTWWSRKRPPSGPSSGRSSDSLPAFWSPAK